MSDLILKINCNGYEWIVDKNTGEIIAEGHRLSAQNILLALGCQFEIEEVDGE